MILPFLLLRYYSDTVKTDNLSDIDSGCQLPICGSRPNTNHSIWLTAVTSRACIANIVLAPNLVSDTGKMGSAILCIRTYTANNMEIYFSRNQTHENNKKKKHQQSGQEIHLEIILGFYISHFVYFFLLALFSRSSDLWVSTSSGISIVKQAIVGNQLCNSFTC